MGGSADRIPEELRGLDRFEARKKLVKQLEKEGLLEESRATQAFGPALLQVRHRGGASLSDQWFVKMKPLAETVMRAYAAGEFHIGRSAGTRRSRTG